ncbi:MAG: carboxypeptidase M32 [Verrucomicrobiaceae bacterium]|nr:carboxypeptidase M32 [Verrucomicrobiaceae bacterium]
MSAYSQLCKIASEISIIESLGAAVDWDQETGMPGDAISFRSRQQAWLSGKAHSLFTSKRFLALLDRCEAAADGLGEVERANVRVWRRQTNRATRLPKKLVETFASTCSKAKGAWVAARQNNDYLAFKPHLERILGLLHEKAERWGYTTEPYDALIDEYEPGAKAALLANLFDTLKPALRDIAKQAVQLSQAVPASLLEGDCPVERQQILNREVAESVGFDFNAGRIDTTAHPFCTRLGPRDVRLTTRYDVRDFTSSLFGVLHEAGHGMYEQGLHADDYGLPSGTAVSLGIHESQSRLWENHVGRSRAFWDRWLPRAAELFPHLAKLNLDDFLRAVNRAEFSFIRVEADEATYDLHILLRFTLERRLLNGELRCDELPDAWNDEFHALFGTTPPDYKRGCLQDIHWSMGALGYFPTYTLGNLNAAQLFHHAMQDAAIAHSAGLASYEPLLTWLRQKIHRPGSTLAPLDLMKAATGEPTTHLWHLEHLRNRFLS